MNINSNCCILNYLLEDHLSANAFHSFFIVFSEFTNLAIMLNGFSKTGNKSLQQMILTGYISGCVNLDWQINLTVTQSSFNTLVLTAHGSNLCYKKTLI